MKSVFRRFVGLIEVLFGIGIFIMFIKHIIADGLNFPLAGAIPSIMSIGFIYYGKKYLFNEVSIFDDIKTIKPDEALFNKAVEKAQCTLNHLIEKIKEEKDEYLIKFAIEDSKRNILQVWGTIHKHEGNVFNVSIISSLKKQEKVSSKRIIILESKVLDWMIKTAEGDIYGSFTMQLLAQKVKMLGYKLDKKSKKYIARIENKAFT